MRTLWLIRLCFNADYALNMRIVELPKVNIQPYTGVPGIYCIYKVHPYDFKHVLSDHKCISIISEHHSFIYWLYSWSTGTWEIYIFWIDKYTGTPEKWQVYYQNSYLLYLKPPIFILLLELTAKCNPNFLWVNFSVKACVHLTCWPYVLNSAPGVRASL